MASFIYVADPMCSWCYGFGPELAVLLNGLPDIPVRIVLGGLRVDNAKAMDEELKSTLLAHWKQVQGRTGLPFSPESLSRPNFVYNTEPACRAVVAARMLAPQAAMAVFEAIQDAFYVRGQDVTQGEVLADIASAALKRADVEIDAAAFLANWNSEQARAATQNDFTQIKQWGILGFPTLVLEREGQLDLVTSGYAPATTLVAILQSLVDKGPSRTSSA